MGFLMQRMLGIAQRTLTVSNLSASFRALSVTSQLWQDKPKLELADIPNLVPAGTKQQQQQEKQLQQKECNDVFNKINNEVAKHQENQLFAVVQLCGKQFKVTEGDIILIEGYWPPTIGDKLRLEKVLLAGGRNFTLIGRPILERSVVEVQATIIEKTLSHTKTHFKKKRRKQYMRINFQRSPHTMVRINSIAITGQLNEGAPASPPEHSELPLFGGK